jgi:hypothetical protein
MGLIMTDAEKAEYEDMVRLLTVKLEQLAAENARLRSEAGAHDVLRNIYGDVSQPAGVRVKAAQAALNVEKPRLQPQPPPLDLVAEKPEPLAVIVERQRARLDRMERERRDIRVLPSGQVLLLDGNGGNGQDNSSE